MATVVLALAPTASAAMVERQSGCGQGGYGDVSIAILEGCAGFTISGQASKRTGGAQAYGSVSYDYTTSPGETTISYPISWSGVRLKGGATLVVKSKSEDLYRPLGPCDTYANLRITTSSGAATLRVTMPADCVGDSFVNNVQPTGTAFRAGSFTGTIMVGAPSTS